MMWWLLDHPDVEQRADLGAGVDQLVNHDFAGYYSKYAATHFAAAGLDQQRLGRRPVPRASGVLGVPVVYLLFQNVANLAIIGSIMTRHGHGPGSSGG